MCFLRTFVFARSSPPERQHNLHVAEVFLEAVKLGLLSLAQCFRRDLLNGDLIKTSWVTFEPELHPVLPTCSASSEISFDAIQLYACPVWVNQECL